MDFNNFPAIKYLYSLDNRDYPSSVKKYCNPTYDFSRFLISYEKKGISYTEDASNDNRTPHEVIDQLNMLRNNCRKPVVITKPFFSVMEKSEDAFTPFHNLIIADCEGECGVVHAPYLAPGSFLVYNISKGKLSIWVIINQKREERIINTPSTYLSVFSIDKLKGVGHQLVVDYMPLLMGCFEDPVSMYTHAFTILTYLCLRKWAEVEIAEVKTMVKREIKDKKKTIVVSEEGLSYYFFDSKWYTEVCNNNDFNVSGHFRLQPYGDGTKRLIWIDEYTKHGYHRKATIDKVKDGDIILS